MPCTRPSPRLLHWFLASGKSLVPLSEPLYFLYPRLLSHPVIRHSSSSIQAILTKIEETKQKTRTDECSSIKELKEDAVVHNDRSAFPLPFNAQGNSSNAIQKNGTGKSTTSGPLARKTDETLGRVSRSKVFRDMIAGIRSDQVINLKPNIQETSVESNSTKESATEASAQLTAGLQSLFLVQQQYSDLIASNSSPSADPEASRKEGNTEYLSDRINSNRGIGSMQRNVGSDIRRYQLEINPAEMLTAEMLDADEASLERIKQAEQSNLMKYRSILARKSAIRRKGEWSYDWQVALNLLHRALADSCGNDQRSIPEHIEEDVKQDEIIHNLKKNHYRRAAAEIPLPSEWTKLSFAQYVQDLALSAAPLHANRISYASTKLYSHQRIRNCFEILFDQKNRHLISAYAVETALRFYLRQEMLDAMQQLYVFMDEVDFPIRNELYDVILRKTASNLDLHNYTSILQRAIRIGFVPTSKTWASLVICLESGEAQNKLIKFMKEKDLLIDTQVQQDIAYTMLESRLFAPVSDQDQSTDQLDVDNLVKEMNDVFGQNWLTVRSAARILERQCLRASGRGIIRILEVMQEHNISLQHSAMNLLLLRCRRLADLAKMLEILNWFLARQGVALNDTTCALVFHTAWEAKAANVCRVIWAFACAQRHTTRTMTGQLLDLLSTTVSDDGLQEQAQWEWETARFVVGLGIDKTTMLDLISDLVPRERGSISISNKELLASLINGHKEMTKSERQDTARSLVNNDQDIYLRAKYPIGTLMANLQDAWQVDMDWIKEKATQNVSLQEMRRPALQLQFRRNEVENEAWKPSTTPQPRFYIRFRDPAWRPASNWHEQEADTVGQIQGFRL